MAQKLKAQGQKVALLALFDCAAPGAFKRLPSRWIFRQVDKLIERGFVDFLQRLKQKGIQSIANPHNKGKAKKIKSRIPVKVNPLKENKPQPYKGRVILFRAIKRSPAIRKEGYQVDPELGWGNLIAEGLEIQDVSSTHLGILKKPNVQIIAEKLSLYIDKEVTENRAVEDL